MPHKGLFSAPSYTSCTLTALWPNSALSINKFPVNTNAVGLILTMPWLYQCPCNLSIGAKLVLVHAHTHTYNYVNEVRDFWPGYKSFLLLIPTAILRDCYAQTDCYILLIMATITFEKYNLLNNLRYSCCEKCYWNPSLFLFLLYIHSILGSV